MKKKQKKKRNFKPILSGILLFMGGIAVMGLTTNYYLTRTEELTNTQKTANENLTKAVSKPIEMAVPKETEPIETPPRKEEEKPKEFKLSKPCDGKISKEYNTNLTFNKTTGDYRAHTGVDIDANILTKVYPAESGVVTEVFEDPTMGITIVIDHENGFVSRYSNLSTTNMAEIGARVGKDTVISGVGDSAISESGENPHLHFELKKDGKSVNPREFIAF